MLRRFLDWLKYRDARKHRRSTIETYITEPRMKVIYNPFTEKHTWVLLNVKTHVWEWQNEATEWEQKFWYSLSEMTKNIGVTPGVWEHLKDRHQPKGLNND